MIKLLKIKMEGLTETFLFSTGLSITSLMLTGLAVNELHSTFAVQTPLSPIFLLPTLNIFISTCTTLAYMRNRSNEQPNNIDIKKLSILLVFLLFIPALSILGAITSGVYNDNRILLFTITAIAALFTIAATSNKAMPTKIYPFIVLIISIFVPC
ncbi:MAG: hypothetical protein QXX41_06105 [Nitrososphaerota archaeon]